MPKKSTTTPADTQDRQHKSTQDQDADQLSQLQQQLQDMQQQQQDSLAQSQRALADYANLKKRFDRERLEIGGYVTESVISQLLPSIDNLDRAVQFASDQDKKSALFQGLHMTMQQLQQVFADLGVTKLEVKADQDFDPHQHEAIDTAAGPHGKIVSQLQTGYKIKDKVIRPAQVIVGDGQTRN